MCRAADGKDHEGFVSVSGGEVTQGADMSPAKHFVWDNEGPVQVWLSISSAWFDL